MIEAPLALFQEEVKVGFGDAVVSNEMAFRLVRKVLDPVYVVPVDRKNVRVSDAMVLELRDVKSIANFKAVGVKDAIG